MQDGHTSDGKAYLIQFADSYNEFRISELQSLATLYQLNYIDWASVIESYEKDPKNPFSRIQLRNDEDAALLVQRSVLVKSIWELWSDATNFSELHVDTRSEHSRQLWERFSSSEYKYKFSFHSYNRRYDHRQNVDKIEDFQYMDFRGPIVLKGPVDLEIGILEYWKRLGKESDPSIGEEGTWTDDSKCVYRLSQVALGRLICHSWRKNVEQYNLRKRHYIGNTSMEPTLAFIMSNLALSRAGTFAFDPFVGTGSLMLSAALHGSMVGGMDIDGRQIRGNRPSSRSGSSIDKEIPNQSNLFTSAKQYNVSSKMVDFITSDLANPPWRRSGHRQPLFDALICDPPYGVRAGAKRLGKSENHAHSKAYTSKRDLSQTDLEGNNRYPATQPYPLSQLISDLLLFAKCHLVEGGRLVYLLPQPIDQGQDDLPSLKGLRLLHAPSQPLGKWCRRAVVMERLNDDSDDESPDIVSGVDTIDLNEVTLGQISAPNPSGKLKSESHSAKTNGVQNLEFRDRYFARFQAGAQEQT